MAHREQRQILFFNILQKAAVFFQQLMNPLQPGGYKCLLLRPFLLWLGDSAPACPTWSESFSRKPLLPREYSPYQYPANS
jgi:hypothetical protein